MATEKQINANRANAQLSTGPRTEAGKAVVRHNACTHGFYSKEVLLEDENPVELEQLRNNLMEEYDPRGELETALVEIILVCLWKHRRAERWEREFTPQVKKHYNDTNFNNWTADIHNNFRRNLDSLQQHQMAVDRRMYRAMEELKKIQRGRLAKIAESDADSTKSGVTFNNTMIAASHAIPPSVECKVSSPPVIIMGSPIVSTNFADISVSTTSGTVITSSGGIVITNSMPEVSQNVNIGNSSSTTVPDMITTSSKTSHIDVVAPERGIVAGIEAGHNVTSTLLIQTNVEDSMGT